MSKKRAQTATEYMIILAVVIIIALIVIGVLGGIPGIGGGAKGRSSSAYWSSASVAITSYSITAGNVVTLKIRNNLKDSIVVVSANISSSSSTSTTYQVGSSSISLGPGETKTFTSTVGTACSTVGNTYVVKVAITYTDDRTGARYVFTGDGNTLSGVCAQ
jgi:hypothetical protein